MRPSSAKKPRRRSKSVTAMLKDKSRPRTPPMCGPKRSTADPSENVFSRQNRKYLGDLQDAPISCSIVTTEEFDKIIDEKNNTIAMLQELISEYQSRGVSDLQATVGYQEMKAESSVKSRNSNRLSTSSLFGRGKSVRKDATTGHLLALMHTARTQSSNLLSVTKRYIFSENSWLELKRMARSPQRPSKLTRKSL